MENALSATNIGRHYVTGYAAAYLSDRLDGRLFATIADQKKFFGRRLGDAKRELRSALFAARSALVAARLGSSGGHPTAIETAISGIDAELAKL